MGFRQTESDFEYQAKMNFHPKSSNSEAGISLFQKDDNYFMLTVFKENNKYILQLTLAEPEAKPRILQKQMIPDYSGEITFKVKSEDHNYLFYYSFNGAEFILLKETEANHILSKKYTGAYLGVYATSNGQNSKDYADFDWVSYKGFESY
jgi:alpha-N-arabinofuranosidase